MCTELILQDTTASRFSEIIYTDYIKGSSFSLKIMSRGWNFNDDREELSNFLKQRGTKENIDEDKEMHCVQ